MSDAKFKEIETKYNASNIKLKDFIKIAKELNPIKKIEASGYDYYFTKGDKAKRFRAGDLNELTTKEQTNSNNNFIRKEVNIRIIPEETPEKTLEKVTEYVALDGYKFNFSIFKICHIYYYSSFDLVYYTVLDSNMDEIARFLEIEMLEDYPWESIDQAWNKLLEIENKLKPLGISPKKRIMKSLFQLFKR